jgi:hypothetical protein
VEAGLPASGLQRGAPSPTARRHGHGPAEAAGGGGRWTLPPLRTGSGAPLLTRAPSAPSLAVATLGGSSTLTPTVGGGGGAPRWHDVDALAAGDSVMSPADADPLLPPLLLLDGLGDGGGGDGSTPRSPRAGLARAAAARGDGDTSPTPSTVHLGPGPEWGAGAGAGAGAATAQAAVAGAGAGAGAGAAAAAAAAVPDPTQARGWTPGPLVPGESAYRDAYPDLPLPTPLQAYMHRFFDWPALPEGEEDGGVLPAAHRYAMLASGGGGGGGRRKFVPGDRFEADPQVRGPLAREPPPCLRLCGWVR